MKLLFPILVIITLTAALSGCYTVPEREPQELFQQIPNWDNEALKVCCGHLTHCERWQSRRC